jgi:hypothetical protein
VSRVAAWWAWEDLNFRPVSYQVSLLIWLARSDAAGALDRFRLTGTFWLPAPDAAFRLVLRMYQPRQNVLDGTYQPPPVQKTS